MRMHAAANALGRVMGHKNAAAFPDVFLHRCFVIQKIRRDGVQQPPLGVADHVGIDATARRGRGQTDAGQHLAELVNRHPAAGGRVILVILHAHRLGQVPVVLDDEGLPPCAKEIRKKLAMIVKILE